MDLSEQLSTTLIQSVNEAFSTTFSLSPKEHSVTVDLNKGIICSIGMTGSLEGTIALSLSVSDACRLVAKMLGMETLEMSNDVIDGVGEIINMIAGGIKLKLSNTEYHFEIGIPSAVQGQGLKISSIEDSKTLSKGFSCEDIVFCLLVIYKIHKPGEEHKSFAQRKSEHNASAMLDSLLKNKKLPGAQ